MALTITPYSIMLDSANPNMKFPQELMQGSTDAEFIITVLKDGVEQTIDSGAKVTMIINYHVEGSGCNSTHSASYVLTPDVSGFDITIDQGKIKIPFRTEITNAYGTSQMILKIEDGTVAYTYSMLFDVVKNDAYTAQSVPDNLPKFDDLQEDIKQLQTDTSINTQKITTNTNDLNQVKVDVADNKQNLNDKADKDLSNIPAVTGSPEGSILYVKDGTLKHFGMTVDDDKKQINSPYSIEVPPNTLHIGKNVSISENGGFVQNHTESLGKDYLFLDYENDPNTGTKKPIYYKRGAKVIQHPLQNIATTPMTLTTYNIGQTQFDHQTQAFYLNLVDAVTNLCLKVTVNGKDIAFYPDELAWNATTPEEKVASPGYNKIAGLRKMPIKPFWSSLTEYQIVLTFKADAPIRVMGDGVKPYFAIDENPITRLEMATMDDVAAGGGSDTAKDIRDKLAGLSGDERLGIKSLKDVEDTINGDYCKTKLEELTGDDRLDASAVKNLPQPGTGSTTFSGLTDTPADYIGAANKFLAVNAAHTGIEFVDGVAQDKTFVELTDTPTDYTGMSGKIVAVKSSEDGVEFIDNTGGDTTNLAQKDLSNVDDSILKSKGLASGLADNAGVIKNTDELVRINAIEKQDIFSKSIKGDLSKAIDNTQAYKGYFITTFAVDSVKNIITLPDHADIQNGTVFCVDNQDVNSNVIVKAVTGSPILPNTSSINVPHGNILFLSRANTGWVIGFSGFIPSSISRMIADIKIAIPNIGQGRLTIQQIEEKLKDKLKTTSQIAQEFASQLHTVDNLRFTEGMAWAFAEYDFTDDIAAPYHNFISQGKAIVDQETDITSPNTDMYLRMRLPQYIATLVQYVRTGPNTRNDMVRHVINYDEIKDVVYSFFYFTTPIPANTAIKLHFDFFNEFPKPVDEGITIQGDETTELFTGVTDTYYPTAIVEVNPNNSKEALITPYIKVVVPSGISEEPQPPAEYKATAFKLTDGLEAYSDPNAETGVVMGIKHNTVEQKHNPGFLAYLSNPVRIKRLEVGEESYRRFTIAFKHDDIHVPADGVGIKYMENTDVFGIEEYDGLDPNASGGTDFFTIFRTSFGGNAPSDGFIRTMLIKDTATVLDTDDDTYIKDTNGNIIANEKTYKQGDKLGTLETVGVINAKGLKNFKLVVITNMTGDDIYFEPKENGRTGLMIQSLTSTEKTGLALLQYENDTQQDINFTGLVLGNNRTTLSRDLVENTTVRTISAGTSNDDFAGWGYYALTQNTISITDNALAIDGDFSLHHIFGADETQALRNKQVKVTTTLLNPQTSYTVALAKHVETPDDYNKNIFISRSQGGGVIAQGGWAIDFSTQQIINTGSLTDYRTVEKTFTIPNDANNYAILLYPETDFGSAEVKIKEFKVDVINPFMAYYIHSTAEINELKLLDVERFKTFIQNKQAYYSLRYTLTNSESPMPCGEPRFGNANVVVDPSVNVVQGSSARGGEGALKFLLDGSVEIRTSIRISNEKDTNYNARWWFARVSADGSTYTKIDASETTILVDKDSVGTLFEMKPFRIEVQNGDRIALRSQSDIVDGSYIICKDDSKPMVTIKLDFDELVAVKNDVSDLIKHADEILFVENGQPVSDPSAYKVRIDVATSQIDVIKS
jgi:hypothetical protein